MWYSALQIAEYIITTCYRLKQPVSNLKLQKMLYYFLVDFYKLTGRRLFFDNICAWQLGPVVPEVYYEFCSYAGNQIRLIYSVAISEEDEKILYGIVNEYLSIPANVLVNKTHASGSAWDIIYQNGSGNRKIIPYDLIIEKEVG